MYVVGTAGHVDHGKSTLVKALTGIDPDRLRVEKEREMTIDLGFAWLRLPSGAEVSIVDVPGHERFVKNMLAGIGGIDLALLIVAADEGVMPQTREHLAILNLLRVKRGIVVITKKDLVDQEWLTLVMSDVRETLKGTALESAQMVAVSSVTGEGIKELIQLIETELKSTPRRPDTGRPRLPIDRVFSVAGFGTVVTGTLIDGRLTVGLELEVLPKGLKVRVRGLQAHKKKVDEMSPGTRTAVNLTGVDANELARGDVLTTPGWLRPTEASDVKLRVLPGAPMSVTHNASVILYIGTSEVPARVRLLDADELKPGETSWAQVHTEKPIVAVKGDYFIIRNSAGTLGGGEIVDPYGRRHRRRQQSVLERLSVMERGSPEEVVLKALEASEGSECRVLASRANMAWADVQGVLQSLADGKRVVALAERVGQNTLVYSSPGWKSLQDKVRQVLEQYHRQYPLRKGASKEELRSRLNASAPAFVSILRRMQAEGVLVEEGATARLPAHQVRLAPEQQAAAERYLRALTEKPYSPPGDVTVDPNLLNVLIDQRKVVRCTEDVVFAASAYDDMARQVTERIKQQGKITVAEMRDMFSTSRKYALALAEYLDQQHVTRRVGDERVLR